MLETSDSALHERYRDRWFGKYRAFVRDHNDPERLGRVRLEVPTVLGTGRDNWSEWAAPCFPFGGNDDTGMFLVPDEGASVWAEFEGGDPQYPIWTGVWLAKSNPGEQPKESARTCNSAFCKDCEDKKEHQARRNDNLEHKKFHTHPPFYCPRMRVLFKSETGHTIFADDRDGDEMFRIIDRAGQSLTLEAKVKPNVQTGNSQRRGIKDAEKSNQIDIASKIVGTKSRIELTDLCRQYVRLEAWKDKEKIHVVSCDKGRSRWQKILIDTTKGREKLHVFGLNGKQNVVIDSTKGQEKIVFTDKANQTITMSAAPGREAITLKDKKGGKIYLDGLTGNMMVKATNMLLLNT
jgi:hypothetical protein